MKFLWLLIVVLALVAADDSDNSPQLEDNDDIEDSTNTDTDDDVTGGIEGRSRSSGNRGQGSQGNKRFFGGGFGANPGFGGGFGVQPGFGGGLGGITPGFGGGFGGINPGLGGGFGGIASGFGGGLGAVRPPSTCRYWCRTPQGQAYCCENVNEPQSFAGVVKPGFCPPVRPVCPPVRSFLPPASCSNDGACGGIDKCCFDTCLQQHVCKPPQGFGR